MTEKSNHKADDANIKTRGRSIGVWQTGNITTQLQTPKKGLHVKNQEVRESTHAIFYNHAIKPCITMNIFWQVSRFYSVDENQETNGMIKCYR